MTQGANRAGCTTSAAQSPERFTGGDLSRRTACPMLWHTEPAVGAGQRVSTIEGAVVCEAEGRPLLVVISGAPGSGKTIMARVLSERLHLPVVNRDLIKTGLHVTARSEYPKRDPPVCVQGIRSVSRRRGSARRWRQHHLRGSVPRSVLEERPAPTLRTSRPGPQRPPQSTGTSLAPSAGSGTRPTATSTRSVVCELTPRSTSSTSRRRSSRSTQRTATGPVLTRS